MGDTSNETPSEMANLLRLLFFCTPKAWTEFAKMFNNETKLFGDPTEFQVCSETQ